MALDVYSGANPNGIRILSVQGNSSNNHLAEDGTTNIAYYSDLRLTAMAVVTVPEPTHAAAVFAVAVAVLVLSPDIALPPAVCPPLRCAPETVATGDGVVRTQTARR